ncbi:hypothetical protein predicted by Glimmer/Critica [Corynebacterium glutamicum ATCC 13032]|nr:hypothetical protein predicted by Glimmer/Critica [Corynebacterium glutamicum ATCC 13032]
MYSTSSFTTVKQTIGIDLAELIQGRALGQAQGEAQGKASAAALEQAPHNEQ